LARRRRKRRSEASIDERRRRQNAAALALTLGVGTLLLYSQVGGFEFVHYDDDRYVFENDVVRQGLSFEGIRWALTAAHASNWHPLTWISHMVDVELGGLESGRHHWTSVLLHSANAMLLFIFLRWVTARLWPSLAVAALFAVHPLRVESVAWVSERKDVLSGSFFFLALLAWAWYARRPGWRRYVLVAVALALGLASKPMLVTLPLLLLLVDVWPLRRYRPGWWPAPEPGKEKRRASRVERPDPPTFAAASARTVLLEKLPLLALSFAAIGMTIWAQGRGGAISSAEAITPAWRVVNGLVAYVAYLRKTIWPAGLTFFYPHPATVRGAELGSYALAAGGAAVLLAALTWLALRAAPRRPYLLCGWLWYLGMLVPVIGLVQVGSQGMADRYAYLPLVGVYLLAVWGVFDLLDARPAWRPGVALAAAVALGALAWGSWRQIGTWRDSESLFSRAVAVNPENYLALNGLGNVAMRERDESTAADYYERALAAYPDFAPAHNRLGLIHKNRGDLVTARKHYEHALRAAPDYGPAHGNLGNLLRREEDLDGAERHLRRSIEIDPFNATAHSNLGNVLVRRGDLEAAVERYERAIALHPEFTDAHYNLAAVTENLGRLSKAKTHYKEALRLVPGYADAHAGLGRVFEGQGDQRSAAGHYRETLKLKPSRLDIAHSLAWILATTEDDTLRNGDEAVGWAERVAQADGYRSSFVLDTLAAAQAESGRFEDAVRWQTRALELAPPEDRAALEARLVLYRGGGTHRGPR
jgi:tetratricopeptide (TPR) repeat protein